MLPKSFLISIATLLTIANVSLAQSGRFLYLSSPDGAQTEGKSDPGILVFDIDKGHKFVRRIDVPIFSEGLRGFTGNKETHSVYYSTTNRRLGRFDLHSEKIIWEEQYDAGCDRTSITPDGKILYIPTGWWHSLPDSGFLVVDASNGELIKRIKVGPQAHNSIVSLDGEQVFLGTTTMLTAFDTKEERIIKQIKNVGEQGVFPFTITSDNQTAYVCLGGHIGFDVVDLSRGIRTHRVMAGEEAIPNRTHGAGLTPDETELWISDQKGKKLFIFDSTQEPPTQKGFVNLSQGGHGWVCFSLDGKYAWNHTPDVFDTKTKMIIASLRDEEGRPVSSSKFIEVHFENGHVSQMGNEFGLGRR